MDVIFPPAARQCVRLMRRRSGGVGNSGFRPNVTPGQCSGCRAQRKDRP